MPSHPTATERQRLLARLSLVSRRESMELKGDRISQCAPPHSLIPRLGSPLTLRAAAWALARGPNQCARAASTAEASACN